MGESKQPHGPSNLSPTTDKASTSKSASKKDSGVAYVQNHGFENRNNRRKIEMPTFYGEDPEWWFYRGELYFSMSEYFEEEKLRITGVYFEGRTLKWFKWYNDWEPFQK